MAAIYPSRLPAYIRADPDLRAECLLYDALAKLPDPYRIFHGARWIARTKHGPRDCEADFVIAHPTRGLVVLEVKGGRIAYEARRKRWTSNSTEEIQDPVEQASKNKFFLRGKLETLPQRQGRLPAFGHAVAFPDCAAPRGEIHPACPREIVFYSEDLDWPAERVETIFDFWNKQRVAGDAALMRHLEALLARDFELKTSLGTLLRSEDAEILELTEQQFKALDLLSAQSRVAVRGGAGTGKSLLALEKARRLAGEGCRTLLTCFNRPLADHMRQAVGEVEGLTIDTFHGACSKAAEAAGVKLPHPDSVENYWIEVLPDALLEAVERKPELCWDAVVVDEGQDMAASWWDRIELAQTDRENPVLYVFYDDNQNIYGKSVSLPDGLVEIPLTQNLRNTQSIHRDAMRFYEGDLEPAGPEGRPMEVVEIPGRKYGNELSRVLHRLIRDEGVPPERIAVLSGLSRKRSEFGEAETIGAFKCTRDTSGVADHVVVESIHRFKGLQRRAVVLVELERIVESENYSERARHELLYVGMTRAKGHLVVMGPRRTLRALEMGPAGGA